MRAIAAILFVILAAPGVRAETWDVRPDGTGRAVTIQAAVDSCAPGDTVLIHSGTFSGTGNRDVELRGKNILITSSLGPDSTIIDCEGSPAEPHMGFYAHEGEDGTCVISGLTIVNGHGTCGVRCEWASPTIENNVFRDNNGAVIYCSHTRSVVRGNLFSNNNTGSSSPVFCVNDTSDILANTFSGNESTEGASAIYCSYSRTRIAGNVIEYGYTYPGSCAPVTCRYGAYLIEDNRIENNIVFYGNGKGIACSFSEAAITGNTISGNSGIGVMDDQIKRLKERVFAEPVGPLRCMNSCVTMAYASFSSSCLVRNRAFTPGAGRSLMRFVRPGLFVFSGYIQPEYAVAHCFSPLIDILSSSESLATSILPPMGTPDR